MNIGEILIWESSNLLLLITVVIALVMLVRWASGKGGIHGARLVGWLKNSQRGGTRRRRNAGQCLLVLCTR